MSVLEKLVRGQSLNTTYPSTLPTLPQLPELPRLQDIAQMAAELTCQSPSSKPGASSGLYSALLGSPERLLADHAERPNAYPQNAPLILAKLLNKEPLTAEEAQTLELMTLTYAEPSRPSPVPQTQAMSSRQSTQEEEEDDEEAWGHVGGGHSVAFTDGDSAWAMPQNDESPSDVSLEDFFLPTLQ